MIMKYKLVRVKGWRRIWQQIAPSQNNGAVSGSGQPAGLEGCWMEEQLTDLFHASLFHTDCLANVGCLLKYTSHCSEIHLLHQKVLWTVTQ